MTNRRASTGSAPTKALKSGDILVLMFMSLTTPLVLIAVNLRRGLSPIRPVIFALAMVVAGVLFAAALRRWLAWSPALLTAATAVLLFYQWGVLTQIPDDSGFGWLPGAAIPFGVLLAMARLTNRAKSLVAFRWIMIAISSGSFIVAVPLIVSWIAGEPDQPIPVEVIELTEGERPDVVVIVLDGYGRADVLSDMYGFDNSPFLGELADSGFVVSEEARANYSMTIASLSSALSLEYVFPEGRGPTDRSEIAMRSVIAGESTFFRTLASAGYDIEYFESGWEGSRCGDIVTVCHDASLYDELGSLIIDASPFASLVTDIFGGANSHNGLRVLRELPDALSRESGRPQLVFAHVILPHPPLFLDPTCALDTRVEREGSIVGRAGMTDAERRLRRGFYVEQVECVNSMLRTVLAAVDDDDIVVMIGDHGPDSYGQPTLNPRNWTSEAAWERMSVLTAVRIPSSCVHLAYSEMTIVNTFRLVLRCMGADLTFLEDRSYVYPHPPGIRYEDGELGTSVLLENFLR